MERAMFELIPAGRGWRLDGGDRPGHWFADREQAIETAERSAQLRHQLGRRPTGVRMQVEDEWVMLARYG
jgi:hypothetical protein